MSMYYVWLLLENFTSDVAVRTGTCSRDDTQDKGSRAMAYWPCGFCSDLLSPSLSPCRLMDNSLRMQNISVAMNLAQRIRDNMPASQQKIERD